MTLTRTSRLQVRIFYRHRAQSLRHAGRAGCRFASFTDTEHSPCVTSPALASETVALVMGQRFGARRTAREDVLDALESDLAVEDVGRPVEVSPMTDEAPEEFQGRPQMGRRVVLVPQSADGTPGSHHDVSNSESDALDGHSQSTGPVHEPLGEEGISDVSMGGGTISEVESDPVVEEASMCPVLRWLDIVDLTNIFRRRHAFTSPIPQRWAPGCHEVGSARDCAWRRAQ